MRSHPPHVELLPTRWENDTGISSWPQTWGERRHPRRGSRQPHWWLRAPDKWCWRRENPKISDCDALSSNSNDGYRTHWTSYSPPVGIFLNIVPHLVLYHLLNLIMISSYMLLMFWGRTSLGETNPFLHSPCTYSTMGHVIKALKWNLLKKICRLNLWQNFAARIYRLNRNRNWSNIFVVVVNSKIFQELFISTLKQLLTFNIRFLRRSLYRLG